MDVSVVGSRLPDPAVELLREHGFRLVDRHAAAVAAMANGHLTLTIPLAAAVEGEQADEPPLFGKTSSGVVVAATAAATAMRTDERRRRGQRAGPRPAKPSREVAQLINDLRVTGLSFKKVADVLTHQHVPTPSGGDRWHPTTVKRALEAGAAETRIVLRRLGGLLADVRERGTVDDAELQMLGAEHKFHHHRLLLSFEQYFGAPYLGRFVPALERVGDRYRISAKGEELLRLWERSEEIDDAVEYALERWVRGGAGPLTRDQVTEQAEHHAVHLEDLVPRFAVKGSDGSFTLTDEGLGIGRTWRRVVDDDPRERLDIDFWPEPHEERKMAHWDWEDDPLLTR